MHQALPVIGCGVYLMRYATGSHIVGLACAMSIFSRSVADPSSNRPARMAAKSASDAAGGRSRHGEHGSRPSRARAI
jgi:hypothetical protein